MNLKSDMNVKKISKCKHAVHVYILKQNHNCQSRHSPRPLPYVDGLIRYWNWNWLLLHHGTDHLLLRTLGTGRFWRTEIHWRSCWTCRWLGLVFRFKVVCLWSWVTCLRRWRARVWSSDANSPSFLLHQGVVPIYPGPIWWRCTSPLMLDRTTRTELVWISPWNRTRVFRRA